MQQVYLNVIRVHALLELHELEVNVVLTNQHARPYHHNTVHRIKFGTQVPVRVVLRLLNVLCMDHVLTVTVIVAPVIALLVKNASMESAVSRRMYADLHLSSIELKCNLHVI
jgi:hypothetical protein